MLTQADIGCILFLYSAGKTYKNKYFHKPVKKNIFMVDKPVLISYTFKNLSKTD
jgi:hypothetical protein